MSECCKLPLLAVITELEKLAYCKRSWAREQRKEGNPGADCAMWDADIIDECIERLKWKVEEVGAKPPPYVPKPPHAQKISIRYR